MRGPGLFARTGASAVLLGTAVLRAVRIAGNWESVAAFYTADGGLSLPWAVLSAALALGPFAVAVSAAAALWIRADRSAGLAAVNFFAGGFFTLWEGLTVFARGMNGHSAYVGAEPLLSLLVCAVSGVWLFRAQRRDWKKKRRDYDVY